MDPYQIFNLGTECSFKVLFIKFASFSASTKLSETVNFQYWLGVVCYSRLEAQINYSMHSLTDVIVSAQAFISSRPVVTM